MGDGKLGAQPHYARSGLEPVQVIESWDLGFHLGCALKYIGRAGHKEGEARQKDLTKALWYVVRLVETVAAKDGSFPGGIPKPDPLMKPTIVAHKWGLGPNLARAVTAIYDANAQDKADCLRAAVEALRLEIGPHA